MPSINVQIQASGALMSAFIGVSLPRAQAMQAASLQPPPPIMGTFLIDTGTSATCVDEDFIKSLGVQPTGQAGISTPSTQGKPHFCDQFDISVFIPGNAGQQGGHYVPALPVIATQLKSQGIEGLIGRDILDSCTLIYNGSLKHFTLAY